MNMDQDPAGDLSADLELVASLLHKHGQKNFQSLVTLASLRGSTISVSRQSLLSGSTTSASRATTSSSFYPESMSTGRDSTEVQLAQWQPTSAPMSAVFPKTSIDTPFPNPAHALIADSGRDTETDASGDGSSTKYYCPLCAEVGIDKPIKRKTDLKRHFNNIHANDCQWVCKIGGGCGSAFDFQAAYDDHAKREHNGFKDLDPKVNLCRQVVFACGFERCREVFEAFTDAHAPTVRGQYFEHVLSHLSAGTQIHWSYRRRMGNLLRQSFVETTWKEYSRDLVEMTWEPESSALLRKLLECRHIVDVSLLCSYAVQLGSSAFNFPPPEAPSELRMPLLNDCALANQCHQPRQDIRFNQGLLGSTRTVHRISAAASRRSRVVPHSSPSVPPQATFTPPLAMAASGLYHELPPPSMTLASQHMEMDMGEYPMDDNDDMSELFPEAKHKPIEYFVGHMDDGPMEEQIGPFMDNSAHTLPSRSRTSSRRHLLAKKSLDRLRAKRNAGEGDYRMPDVVPPPPACTLPQNQTPSGPLYMSGYEM